MKKTTTEIGRELSEALNPGMEDALDARYGHLLPGMAEGVVDFAYGRQYSRPKLPLRDRYLATIAALTALGGQTKPQLKVNIAGGKSLMTKKLLRFLSFGDCLRALPPSEARSIPDQGTHLQIMNGPIRTFELCKTSEIAFPKAAVHTHRSILDWPDDCIVHNPDLCKRSYCKAVTACNCSTFIACQNAADVIDGQYRTVLEQKVVLAQIFGVSPF